jgi:putative two-component system response regulator
MRSGKMECVLLSDQDIELFKLAEKALQYSYKVAPLPRDIDLIEYLRHNPADLILLTASDTHSAGFRTYDIIKRIPEMTGKPVIFLAENQSEKLERKVLSLGVDDYITLPVTPGLLSHRVKTCLELASLRIERPYVEKYQDAISVSFAELVECRDVTTGGHLKNTTRYFNILLQEAIDSGDYKDIISPGDARDLLRSATLHDIGKIGINDDILRKEAALDYNEYEYMKTHTTLGMQAFERIIKETGGTRWLYLAKDMAYCHHERWDGTGYPNGLKGEEIPIHARMLTIADVYDALTSNRAYKEAYSHKKAVEIIIEGKGSVFDPNLVDLFIKANKRFEEVLMIKNRSTETIERE